MRKILSTLLAVMILLASSTTQAFASEVSAPGEATTSAVLTTEATLMNVTLPLAVMIYVDADGNVFTPDNLQITNNSAGPIQVLSLEVVPDNGWTLDPVSTDYINYKSGLKHFNMTLNGMDPALGALTFPTPINGGESLLLEFDAEVSPQKEALNAIKIGEMIITVDWYSDEAAIDPEVPDPEDPEVTDPGETDPETGYPAGYVLAADSDFEGDYDGGFMYIGTAENIIMPATIKGVNVTSYRNMFANTGIKGVISENPNITTMEQMFQNTSSDTLELDLNTTSVTTMAKMFSGSQALSLDLSGFSTSNLVDMSNMFADSKALSLDLSSMDTRNVTNMTAAFSNSSASVIDLSATNTSNVTNMQNLFANSKVLSLDLTNFETSKVTSMSGMFKNCEARSISFDGSYNTASVLNMNSMFEGAKVEALDLTNFVTSNTTGMMYMFRNCEATTINFGSGFDTSKLISMTSMFEGSKAEVLDLTMFITASVTNLQAMFKNSAATTINLNTFSTYQVTNYSSMFEGSKVLTLDLSTFDLGYPTPTMTNMFSYSTATTGYTKTTGIASTFNSISNKPVGLVFTTK
ncbi:MAG: lipoprotein [Herbinix sp.]|jgi:surface protein|nr:lipoprotein [Herbinix sp.]